MAAADAPLAFDRDAEGLQRGDVAPHGAPVDVEPSGDLRPRRRGLSLE